MRLPTVTCSSFPGHHNSCVSTSRCESCLQCYSADWITAFFREQQRALILCLWYNHFAYRNPNESFKYLFCCGLWICYWDSSRFLFLWQLIVRPKGTLYTPFHILGFIWKITHNFSLYNSFRRRKVRNLYGS